MNNTYVYIGDQFSHIYIVTKKCWLQILFLDHLSLGPGNNYLKGMTTKKFKFYTFLVTLFLPPNFLNILL